MRRVLSIIALSLLVLGTLRSQEPAPLTPEWLQSESCRRIARTPDVKWLRDGKLLIHDPSNEQSAFEIFDPATRERGSVLSERTALLHLNGVLGEARPELPPPADVSEDGERALYELEGDIFVLYITSGRVHRLTNTPAPEWSARFSPDGMKVAFIRANDLYAADLGSSKTLRLTRDGSENILNGTLSWVYWEEVFGRQDLGYWWSPDSRSIAFLRSDESMVTEMTYVSFHPQVPRVLHQKYPKVGTTNPVVRAGMVALEEKPKIVWADVADGAYEYLCRVKWLPGSRRIAVQTMPRDQRSLDLWLVGREDGKATHVLQETDPAWVNVNDDLYFLEDGKHFLWVSERTGYAHLYRYTLDGKLVNAVTSGDWALRASNPIFWLRKAVVALDEKGDWVYFSSLKDSSVEKHLYRVHFDGTGLERITKKPGTWTLLASPDARYFTSEFSDAHTPPSLSVIKADGSPLAELSPPRVDLVKDLGLSYPELFTIPAADGFAMPAMVFKPADFDPKRRYPVIVHVYGGPSAPSVENSWQGWMYFDTMLTRKGFVVVTFDNRSATAISKKLENTIAEQMTGDGELGDLVAGVRWLKDQPWVDGERVGMWGWSNGGMMTLLGMTRSKEFKAGISVAPVTRWIYYDTKWGETANKLPSENEKGYENTDLVKRAKDLHGRLLLVHGTYDDNVHIQNTWDFVNELVSSGKLFELMIYPMRQHGLADRAARAHLWKTMLSFWERNL